MLHPWTYEICLWNCSTALESVATQIKRYKSEIEIGIQHYLDTEVKHIAIYGPYDTKPIEGLHTSPLLIRPKPKSDHRRVKVDLSGPEHEMQCERVGICYMYKVR